jgi:predicted DNA-binding transcriptional regulator AlpA
VSNLIDITEIAQRLKLRRDYVRDKLVKTGDFPRPAINISQRIRKWEEEAIQAWLEKQKQGAGR